MFAIIDIETTGGSAARDRITEIAIILHDGKRKIREFSTLINPERLIPSYITDITGIDDGMVADAPKFYEVAREIVELTQDCVFVAHNVGFDYGFIREEFKRLGFQYQRDCLCTVRTSRKLIPGLRSYSLGKLCNTLGIVIHDRHRALGDAAATVTLLEQLLNIEPDLAGFSRKVPRDPFNGIPEGVDRQSLKLLPEGAGLYFFHDSEGKTLFADKSDNIRRAALKLLRDLKKKTKKNIPVPPDDVREVTWELTGSELLATLRLPGAIEHLAPGYVAVGRKRRYKVSVYAYRDQRDYVRLYVDKSGRGGEIIAEFPAEADAKAALEARLKKHGLCGQLIGLEQGSGPCGYKESEICAGACLGEESSQEYNLRLAEALKGLGFPFSRFLLVGTGRSSDEVSVVCVEDGSCLGYAYLDSSQSWTEPAAVVSLLNPFANLDEGGRIIRQYLPKIKFHQIIPY